MMPALKDLVKQSDNFCIQNGDKIIISSDCYKNFEIELAYRSGVYLFATEPVRLTPKSKLLPPKYFNNFDVSGLSGFRIVSINDAPFTDFTSPRENYITSLEYK